METRANYLLIGVFTLAVIFGAFGFVWWFERVGDASSRASYEVVYDGSVSGLRKGSAVNFNGIRVGEVYGLTLDAGDPHRVIAHIGIGANTPIRADTKAGLEFQGLTGIASVTLTGGKTDAPKLVAEGGKLPRIVADPSQMQDLMQAARALVARIDKMVAENEQKVDEILKNVAGFTGDLNTNGKEMMTDLSAAAKAVRDAASNLGEAATPTLKEYRLLAQDARRTATDISRFVRQLEQNPSQIIFGRRSGSAAQTPEGAQQTPAPARAPAAARQTTGRPTSGQTPRAAQ
jgi:phospholipid/cholesterol/gamma-HCH transport system substrate-binding protein